MSQSRQDVPGGCGLCVLWGCCGHQPVEPVRPNGKEDGEVGSRKTRTKHVKTYGAILFVRYGHVASREGGAGGGGGGIYHHLLPPYVLYAPSRNHRACMFCPFFDHFGLNKPEHAYRNWPGVSSAASSELMRGAFAVATAAKKKIKESKRKY